MNPNPDTVVAKLTISLHDDGALSVSGNIGDVTLALAMLDHAKDALRNQLTPRDQIVIPNRDVEAQQSPLFPTLPMGDMRPEDRGD